VATDFINRPVDAVDYWVACRFVNWLSNGQPTGAEGNGTTETGTYTLNGYLGTDGRAIPRNPGSIWALTSEDEWYKAAYYKAGSTNAGYWDYPTRSNTPPRSGHLRRFRQQCHLHDRPSAFSHRQRQVH
jgi:hypothetical protein